MQLQDGNTWATIASRSLQASSSIFPSSTWSWTSVPPGTGQFLTTTAPNTSPLCIASGCYGECVNAMHRDLNGQKGENSEVEHWFEEIKCSILTTGWPETGGWMEVRTHSPTPLLISPWYRLADGFFYSHWLESLLHSAIISHARNTLRLYKVKVKQGWSYLRLQFRVRPYGNMD